MESLNVNYFGEIEVEMPLSLKVKLTKNDVFNWLNFCKDAATLKYLGIAALSLARSIEHPNDDERSW